MTKIMMNPLYLNILNVKVSDEPEAQLQGWSEGPYDCSNICLYGVTGEHVFDVVQHVTNGIHVL